MDVVKIRLQAQRHSLMDPLDVPKYRNAGHAAYLIVKEEGLGALYKGVALTALRQGMLGRECYFKKLHVRDLCFFIVNVTNIMMTTTITT